MQRVNNVLTFKKMNGPSEFEQNIISKEFVNKANELISRGIYDQIGLSKLIGFNKSSLSQVMNGARNIPIGKWESFQKVYECANATENQTEMEQHNNDSLTEKLIKSLESQIVTLERENTRLDARVKALEGDLKLRLDENRSSLNILVRNQLSALTLEIAIHREMVGAMAKSPEHKEEILRVAYKEAARMRLAVEKKGNLFEVDNGG